MTANFFEIGFKKCVFYLIPFFSSRRYENIIASTTASSGQLLGRRVSSHLLLEKRLDPVSRTNGQTEQT
ncbi:MAG: hypothetical protein WBF33_23145 [Candidatus Nitrosopolaris sp.]